VTPAGDYLILAHRFDHYSTNRISHLKRVRAATDKPAVSASLPLQRSSGARQNQVH